MYSNRVYIYIAAFVLCSISASAQTDIEKYEAFKRQTMKKYNDFRDKANRDYADFMKQVWETFHASQANAKPKEVPVSPIEMPEEDLNKVKGNIPLPFKEVVMPSVPKPQPLPLEPIKEFVLPVAPITQPIEPIKEEAKPLEPIVEVPQSPAHIPQPTDKRFPFIFFGTEAKVRLSEDMHFKVNGVDEESISQGWRYLSENKKFDNLIRDCLELRVTLGLSDWAYLHMLQNMAEAFCGKNTNEATLLMAYVYCQSGYQMRLGQNDGHLYLLYASQHYIYNSSYFQIDGKFFYPLDYDGMTLNICKASFPKEQPLSLYISSEQRFSPNLSDGRTLRSERYSDVAVDVKVNKNRLDFFSSYPCSELDDNCMTSWAMYAETPMDAQIRETLYPSLRNHFEGLSKREAAERLLNWVQTAFDYEYDEKVWGTERVFFAEESIYYPFCDCEDRSILLTRLYRDLLGLECLLIHYPGHLATAVLLPGEQDGDYIELNGKRYTIADPTYIGATIGCTMPNMNNQEASVVLLK